VGKKKLYDTASGRLLGKFFPDDERFQEIEDAEMEGRTPLFSTTKPSAARKEAARAEGVVGTVVKDPALAKTLAPIALAAAPRALRSLPKAIKALTNTPIETGVLSRYVGGATALPLSGFGVSVLAAAGLGSYFTTKWLLEKYSKGSRQDAALKAYLKSRREMAAALGRPLTTAELQALNAHYQQVVREIKASKF